jgi:hypothetical protein
MILKVLRKLITAPLHIFQHSYKRAQEGFKFLTERPGYVQYRPEAKVADGRAYISPVFELAGPSAPGAPQPKVKLYEEKKALKGYTTQYEYATEFEKPIEYDDFAAEVFNNLVENIQENIKENKNIKAVLRVKIKLDDGSTTWISTTHLQGDLNKYTSEEDIRKMVKEGFENELQEKITFWCGQYKHEMVGSKV